jgi:flagellar protein FliS
MNGTALYQETAITTQDKGRLVVMLYEGAIKFLNISILDIQSGNFEGKGNNISKARDIIFELNTVLDMETGGEIAQNLRGLYNFIGRHLTQASIECNIPMIQEVINILKELNEGWKSVAR